MFGHDKLDVSLAQKILVPDGGLRSLRDPYATIELKGNFGERTNEFDRGHVADPHANAT